MLPCQWTERCGRAEKDASQITGYLNENNLQKADSRVIVKQILHVINA